MLKIYNEDNLKKDYNLNFRRVYQQCSISVMDTIADPDIKFDDKGICNYYYEYLDAAKSNIVLGDNGRLRLKEIASQIKIRTKGEKYDCIVGLSGGADSTFLALLAKEIGLNPLLVHFDYGWNSELAVKNIESTVSKLGLDLYTYVMDWEEFKDLQRAYFKASVLDLDVPADHMIFGALFKVARKYNIKHILSGNNVATEHTLPKTWNYNKFDLKNLRDIHSKFGEGKLRKLPKLGLWYYAFYQLVKGINTYYLLNYVEYNKDDIKRVITEKLDWKDYGGKHHESVFTRFYQGYILPNKFGIDKRKAHLSNLIFAGQITKSEALEELGMPPYDLNMQKMDFEYVGKKLGFTLEEFDKILSLPNQSHLYFKTDLEQRKLYFKIMKNLKPLTSILKVLKGIK
jgi:N-acetyl sugar amidotransferase